MHMNRWPWWPQAFRPAAEALDGSRRRSVAALFVVASCLTLAALVCPMPPLLRLLQDDGFYYVGIALNWVRGSPSTFDGIQPTNGYHPLWQYLVLLPAWFLRDPEWLARAMMVMGIWMCVAAAFMFEAYLRRIGSPLASGSLLWLACAVLPAPIYGMETALAILACALCLTAWPARPEEHTARRGAGAGMAAAGLFLARLDTMPFLAAMAAVAVFGRSPDGRPHRPFAVALIAIEVVFVAGYFVSNRLIWGHLATVSMLAKAGRTELLHPWLIHLGTILGLALVAAFAGLMWLARIAGRRDRAGGVPSGALWLALGSLGYMAVIAGTGGVETYGWYFGVVAASGAVLLPLWLAHDPDAAPRRAARGSRWLVAACLVAAAWVLGLTWIKQVNFVQDYRVAKALAHVPPGRLIFAATDCGIRGSISRQHCLNLDGLTGSYEFQEALRDDRFVEWLRGVGLNASLGPVEHVPGSPTATATLLSRPGMSGIARKAIVTVHWPAVYDFPDVSVYTVVAIRRPVGPPPAASRGSGLPLLP
jgi:hypothetical protein